MIPPLRCLCITRKTQHCSLPRNGPRHRTTQSLHTHASRHTLANTEFTAGHKHRDDTSGRRREQHACDCVACETPLSRSERGKAIKMRVHVGMRDRNPSMMRYHLLGLSGKDKQDMIKKRGQAIHLCTRELRKEEDAEWLRMRSIQEGRRGGKERGKT